MPVLPPETRDRGEAKKRAERSAPLPKIDPLEAGLYAGAFATAVLVARKILTDWDAPSAPLLIVLGAALAVFLYYKRRQDRHYRVIDEEYEGLRSFREQIGEKPRSSVRPKE